MPVATDKAEQAMNDKVAEICEIMFKTLKRTFPERDDIFLMNLTRQIMDDINNGGGDMNTDNTDDIIFTNGTDPVQPMYRSGMKFVCASPSDKEVWFLGCDDMTITFTDGDKVYEVKREDQ